MTRHPTSLPPEDRGVEAAGVLSIGLIGGLRLSYAGQPVVLKQKKAAALLGLLALAPGGSITREEARGLLWPDSDEAAAQTSLRNVLWTLRAALDKCGFDGFGSDRSSITLDPGRIGIDVDNVLDNLDKGRVDPVLQFEPQALAQFDRGFSAVSDSFAARMSEQAAHFARLVRARLGKCIETEADAEARIAMLQFIADMEPADEAAARNLIRAYWRNGQVSNALVIYQSLWNMLDLEFGEEPSEETQALIVEMKTSAPLPQSMASDTRPRIIVRRGGFEHLDAPVVGALHQLRGELCANLARFREWKVFDAELIDNGAMPARGGGNFYGLSLSTRANDSTLECRAVLADLSNGELLWSEDFTGAQFALAPRKGGVADRIAAALNLHLAARAGRMARRADPTASAYERWVEAQELMQQFKPESWQQSEQKLDALIADFPEFSRAYSSRAAIENMRQISFPGTYSAPELHMKALRLAGTAIELDPMDSRAQLAMGWSACMSRQFGRSELAFDLAFQYNENDPWTITSSAVGLAFCDHLDASRHLLDVLYSLNFELDLSHWSYVAAIKFMEGRYQDCVDASERSHEISHDVPAWHAAALALLGRYDEAARMAARFEEIARANWIRPGPLETSEITRWLVSGFPFRNRDTWLALRDGLRLAGMPVPNLVESDAIARGYHLDPTDE